MSVLLAENYTTSSCPVGPIFARTQPPFGRTNIHYVIFIKVPPSHSPSSLHIEQVHLVSFYAPSTSIRRFFTLCFSVPSTRKQSFLARKMNVFEHGTERGLLKTPTYRFRVDGRNRRFSNAMMS